MPGSFRERVKVTSLLSQGIQNCPRFREESESRTGILPVRTAGPGGSKERKYKAQNKTGEL